MSPSNLYPPDHDRSSVGHVMKNGQVIRDFVHLVAWAFVIMGFIALVEAYSERPLIGYDAVAANASFDEGPPQVCDAPVRRSLPTSEPVCRQVSSICYFTDIGGKKCVAALREDSLFGATLSGMHRVAALKTLAAHLELIESTERMLFVIGVLGEVILFAMTLRARVPLQDRFSVFLSAE